MATSLMRRNPFGAIDHVQSRMWDWFTTPYGSTPLSKLFGEVNSYIPPVDIYETNEEIVVAASLPGLDVDKVDIQVLEDNLTLSGEQNSVVCFDPEEKMVQHLQGIPRYGKFSFSFTLPCAVEPEQSQAKYENGLLCMRFLKAAKVRAVRVPISGTGARPVIVETQAPQIADKQARKTAK